MFDNASRELLPGTVLDGRYEIQARLGSGTFSSVYRARDRSLGADYALKVLRNMDGADEEALTRFKREALLSQKVAHEDCCRIYDFLSVQGLSILKMELVDGWTLAQLLARLRPIPLPLGLSLAVQACGAVGALHRQDVIHRDIKASNLMVNRRGRIKVMDLGVSWAPEMSSLTMAGTLLGTPSYMAPELILHQKATARSDVYALGALAYYLVCGRLPFAAPDLVKLFMMQVQEAPPRPRDLRPELSAGMEALLLRSLDKDPERRPADAVAMESEWRDTLGVEPEPDLVGSILGDLERMLDALDFGVDLDPMTVASTQRNALEAATQRTPGGRAPVEVAEPDGLSDPSRAGAAEPASAPPVPGVLPAAAGSSTSESARPAADLPAPPLSVAVDGGADEPSLDTRRRQVLVRGLVLALLALVAVVAVLAGFVLRH